MLIEHYVYSKLMKNDDLAYYFKGAKILKSTTDQQFYLKITQPILIPNNVLVLPCNNLKCASISKK